MTTAIKYIIFFLIFGLLSNIKAQELITIDTAEVYVLSYFEYSGDKNADSLNHYRIVILKDNNEIETFLTRGLEEHQHISYLDTMIHFQINELIDKYFIGNLFLEPGSFGWFLYNSIGKNDSTFNYWGLRTPISHMIANKYRGIFDLYDVTDYRIIRDLSGEWRKPFDSCGIYYQLLKVKMSYILFDDQKDLCKEHITMSTHSFFHLNIIFNWLIINNNKRHV